MENFRDLLVQLREQGTNTLHVVVLFVFSIHISHYQNDLQCMSVVCVCQCECEWAVARGERATFQQQVHKIITDRLIRTLKH